LESEREAREIKGYPDTYELVTFWRSESERDAAKAWLEEALPNAVGRIEAGYGGFASSPGELAFHS
jgi:heme-degrading monooxygenase HmoA